MGEMDKKIRTYKHIVGEKKTGGKDRKEHGSNKTRKIECQKKYVKISLKFQSS
jgi:hypothetical protein